MSVLDGAAAAVGDSFSVSRKCLCQYVLHQGGKKRLQMFLTSKEDGVFHTEIHTKNATMGVRVIDPFGDWIKGGIWILYQPVSFLALWLLQLQKHVSVLLLLPLFFWDSEQGTYVLRAKVPEQSTRAKKFSLIFHECPRVLKRLMIQFGIKKMRSWRENVIQKEGLSDLFSVGQ